MPGAAITKSIVSRELGRKTEEIFVDVIEKISVTFSSSGYILTSEIDGTIQMKSYLGGHPEIRLALNNDLSVGRDYNAPRSGVVILDYCNFHELVHLDSFDVDRALTIVAPEGELHIMNYRITKAFKPPFRINVLIEEAGPFKIVGGSEHTLHARLTFSHEMHGNVSKEAGPINMTFTIQFLNVSGLQVKYLQIAKKSSTSDPYRWARYVTQANSYVARLRLYPLISGSVPFPIPVQLQSVGVGENQVSGLGEL